MGTGIRTPVNWQNIAVVNHASGRPYLELSPPLAALVQRHGVMSVHVSLTDERGMAAAFVVLEGQKHGVIARWAGHARCGLASPRSARCTPLSASDPCAQPDRGAAQVPTAAIPRSGPLG
jgi:hypothetical protein